MNYRLFTLHNRSTHTADGVIVEDIDLQDPVSSIVIGLETANTGNDQTEHPLACITQIDIVDGSEVLYSLDGFEASALDWYQAGGKFRANYNYALNGGSHQNYVGINFGRWLWDTQYALDPKKFRNPQLRITLDINGGGNSTATVYVTVWAAVFDQKVISPVGFLMAKELKNWTMAASTDEVTEMPLDFPYRAIYFRPALRGTEPNQAVSNIKIYEDEGKRIIYDHGAQDIERVLNQMYPDVEELWYYSATVAQNYLYVAPSTRVVAQMQGWEDAVTANDYTNYDGDGGRLIVRSGTNTANVQILVKGRIPHSTYRIPMGMANDENDWLDPRQIGKLKANITGAAAATGYLFTEQARWY